MKELLRKKDVVDAVGVAKSTVSDWISEFHMYIPTIKQGSTIYYKPLAVDVLKEIKEMRDQNVAKPEIAERLARKFPINADDVEQSVSKAINNETERSDALITVMATMGKAVEQMARQDEQMREIEKVINAMQSEVAAARESESKAIEEVRRLEERIQALEEQANKPRKGLFKWFGG